MWAIVASVLDAGTSTYLLDVTLRTKAVTAESKLKQARKLLRAGTRLAQHAMGPELGKGELRERTAGWKGEDCDFKHCQ